MYLIIKNFHMTFAALAVSGFLLRGYWRMTGSPLYRNRAARIVPHINDALFLATGIWLISILNLQWTQHAWLLAKFAGLAGYIGFGMVAFRFGRSSEIRLHRRRGADQVTAQLAGVFLVRRYFAGPGRDSRRRK